jgi:2-hydroxy-3-keto-5-methylthiopentenyl-1-phosphate phosphatase
MDLVVLCDFDGTITKIDTAEFTLSRFAKGDWKSIDRQFENGDISLEECLRREFRLVTASPREILEESEKVVDFRPHFEQLAKYCKKNNFPLIIVSAGLDFLIDHFLRLKDWKELVVTYTAKARPTSTGVRFTFPKLFDKTSANFKQDLVRQWRAKGKKIAYVGDGSGDYDAAREADYIFAIDGSRLAKLCEKDGIPYTRIIDFKEVVDALKAKQKAAFN